MKFLLKMENSPIVVNQCLPLINVSRSSLVISIHTYGITYRHRVDRLLQFSRHQLCVISCELLRLEHISIQG